MYSSYAAKVLGVVLLRSSTASCLDVVEDVCGWLLEGSSGTVRKGSDDCRNQCATIPKH